MFVKVEDGGHVGRHLVATHDIEQGEILIKEDPLIWGPSQITLPVCLGCGANVNQNNSTSCTKCGWPVCDQECQNSPDHTPECHYTQQREEKVNQHIEPSS